MREEADGKRLERENRGERAKEKGVHDVYEV